MKRVSSDYPAFILHIFRGSAIISSFSSYLFFFVNLRQLSFGRARDSYTRGDCQCCCCESYYTPSVRKQGLVTLFFRACLQSAMSASAAGTCSFYGRAEEFSLSFAFAPCLTSAYCRGPWCRPCLICLFLCVTKKTVPATEAIGDFFCVQCTYCC